MVSLHYILQLFLFPVYLLYRANPIHVLLAEKLRSGATWWFTKDDTASKLARKTRSPYCQPNSLPKSQFNLAVLLLCYKMNNCLWVHSQTHYCFYITSKDLRQAKDIALLIVLRDSTFPSHKESMLKVHLGDRSQIEDQLQQTYLHIRAGLQECLVLGILKSVFWTEDCFCSSPPDSYRTLELT